MNQAKITESARIFPPGPSKPDGRSPTGPLPFAGGRSPPDALGSPNFYFGGPQVLFWGPMAWTVIFGLTFSTFLTLVIVPVMYRLTTLAQKKLIDLVHLRKNGNGEPVPDEQTGLQLNHPVSGE